MPSLKISDNGRYITHADGSPFFYLACTGWELFHRLGREDADLYLSNRAAKGFTAIQAVVLGEEDGLRVPNAYGELPLLDMDPSQPNEKYFEHVDYIVANAASVGLYIAMLPTWGDKVTKAWGTGPVVFDETNARVYGEWLGRRYQNAPIIWVLVGDRDASQAMPVWRGMAQGIREGDGGANLMTAHAGAGKERRSASAFFHDEPWLDINMAYSGHQWGDPNWQLIMSERDRTPPKPTFDGEPRYENHPYIGDGSGIYANRSMWDGITRAGSHQIRQAGYWAMLAGACGHTYGCHDIWQMTIDGRKPKHYSNTVWQEAIHFEGSYQMGLMRRFLETRPWHTLQPDLSPIAAGQAEGEDHIQAAITEDESCAMAYVPHGKAFTMDVSRVTGSTVAASWFRPHDGSWVAIGVFGEGGSPKAPVEFVPPRQGNISDWVLVLDDASKGYSTEPITIPNVRKRICEEWATES